MRPGRNVLARWRVSACADLRRSPALPLTLGVGRCFAPPMAYTPHIRGHTRRVGPRIRHIRGRERRVRGAYERRMAAYGRAKQRLKMCMATQNVYQALLRPYDGVYPLYAGASPLRWCISIVCGGVGDGCGGAHRPPPRPQTPPRPAWKAATVQPTSAGAQPLWTRASHSPSTWRSSRRKPTAVKAA